MNAALSVLFAGMILMAGSGQRQAGLSDAGACASLPNLAALSRMAAAVVDLASPVPVSTLVDCTRFVAAFVFGARAVSADALGAAA